MKHYCYPLSLLALSASLYVSSAQAIDIDKWTSAGEIHYHITGEFDDRVSLAPEGGARAIDRVVVELVTDAGSIVKGDIKITNFPTKTGDLRPFEKTCHTPALSGEYEHYTLESLDSMAGGSIMVMAATVTTYYPPIEVPVACTGGKKTREAHTEEEPEDFFIPMMSMYLMDPAVVNSDKHTLDSATSTFTVRELGWTWTYKATPR